MKTIILTVIVTFIILIGGLLIYVSSGLYNISQLDPHNGLTKFLISKTTHSSINKRIGENAVPANYADTINLIGGFQHYEEMCVCCHGAPGVEAWEMAKGLYPKPPLMYKRKKQEDPQEFFWIIKNGVKMTSMPAYAPTHSDAKLWEITAFVTEKLNKMSPEEYGDWQKKYKKISQMDVD
jgi:mono/diheme cytochrome c family protein